MAHQAEKPKARRVDGEVSGGRFTAVPVRLYTGGSSGALRSARGAVRALAKTTDETVEEIATRVGYAEGVTLRTLLRRRLGQGVKEIGRSAA